MPGSSSSTRTSATTTPFVGRSTESTRSFTSRQRSASGNRCTRLSTTRRSTRSAPPSEISADDGTELEPEPTAETKPLRPTSIYAINKRDHEEMTLAIGAAYGIPSVALRFFNVYGPRQALSNPYTGAAAIFASRLLNDRPPLVFEDGNQTRDFIDVRDVVRCCSLALTSDRADGYAVNVGTGRATSVLDVARVISEGLGKQIEPEIVNQYRAGDIRHCYADPRLAEELLGFRAEVAFGHGMQELLAWLETQEASDSVDAAREALAARGLAR